MPTRVAILIGAQSRARTNGTLRPPSDNMAFNFNDHRWSPWSERETPALVADKEALVMRQSAADAAARREETLLLMLGRQQEQLRQTASKIISSPARSVPQETVLVEQITAAGETVLVETVLPGTRRVLRVLRDGVVVEDNHGTDAGRVLNSPGRRVLSSPGRQAISSPSRQVISSPDRRVEETVLVEQVTGAGETVLVEQAVSAGRVLSSPGRRVLRSPVRDVLRSGSISTMAPATRRVLRDGVVVEESLGAPSHPARAMPLSASGMAVSQPPKVLRGEPERRVGRAARMPPRVVRLAQDWQHVGPASMAATAPPAGSSVRHVAGWHQPPPPQAAPAGWHQPPPPQAVPVRRPRPQVIYYYDPATGVPYAMHDGVGYRYLLAPGGQSGGPGHAHAHAHAHAHGGAATVVSGSANLKLNVKRDGKLFEQMRIKGGTKLVEHGVLPTPDRKITTSGTVRAEMHVKG